MLKFLKGSKWIHMIVYRNDTNNYEQSNYDTKGNITGNPSTQNLIRIAENKNFT